MLFQVNGAGSRDIEAAVARDELELGIVTLPTRGRDVDEKPLTRDRIVLVASKIPVRAARRRR